MMTFLDPIGIYDRGVKDLASLAGAERLIFMLQDFDILIEMEGWDHFFLHEHHFIWYSEMREWLRIIGDFASLAVLDSYETHLKTNGVALSPIEIERLLNTQDNSSLQCCVDWGGQYCDLKEFRWAKASAYLEGQGLRMQTD
jgi:hypothetical protein